MQHRVRRAGERNQMKLRYSLHVVVLLHPLHEILLVEQVRVHNLHPARFARGEEAIEVVLQHRQQSLLVNANPQAYVDKNASNQHEKAVHDGHQIALPVIAGNVAVFHTEKNQKQRKEHATGKTI